MSGAKPVRCGDCGEDMDYANAPYSCACDRELPSQAANDPDGGNQP